MIPLSGSPGSLPVGDIAAGPWGLHLLSDYSTVSKRDYSRLWSLRKVQRESVRGGTRGLSPRLLVVSVNDVIVAQVRDSDDRIAEALLRGDLRRSVELALKDKLSLRKYNWRDIAMAYVHSLLSPAPAGTSALQPSPPTAPQEQTQLILSNQTANPPLGQASRDGGESGGGGVFDPVEVDKIAQECVRTLGHEAPLWESAIHLFMNRRLLSALAPHIPTSDPRLSVTTYEVSSSETGRARYAEASRSPRRQTEAFAYSSYSPRPLSQSPAPNISFQPVPLLLVAPPPRPIFSSSLFRSFFNTFSPPTPKRSWRPLRGKLLGILSPIDDLMPNPLPRKLVR